MQNLKTAKIHTLKMHSDRIQAVAEALAELSAGEVLAQRLASSHELSRMAAGLLIIKAGFELHHGNTRGPEPSEN